MQILLVMVLDIALPEPRGAREREPPAHFDEQVVENEQSELLGQVKKKNLVNWYYGCKGRWKDIAGQCLETVPESEEDGADDQDEHTSEKLHVVMLWRLVCVSRKKESEEVFLIEKLQIKFISQSSSNCQFCLFVTYFLAIFGVIQYH